MVCGIWSIEWIFRDFELCTIKFALRFANVVRVIMSTTTSLSAAGKVNCQLCEIVTKHENRVHHLIAAIAGEMSFAACTWLLHLSLQIFYYNSERTSQNLWAMV
jgi:hypothetical protein